MVLANPVVIIANVEMMRTSLSCYPILIRSSAVHISIRTQIESAQDVKIYVMPMMIVEKYLLWVKHVPQPAVSAMVLLLRRVLKLLKIYIIASKASSTKIPENSPSLVSKDT